MSVLVSPLLDFSNVSCFEIQYAVYFTANVDGFIENSGAHTVYRLFELLEQGSGMVSKTVVVTVPSQQGADGRVRFVVEEPVHGLGTLHWNVPDSLLFEI